MHTSTSDEHPLFFSKNKTFSKDEISEVEYAVIQHVGSGRQEDDRVKVVVDHLQSLSPALAAWPRFK